MAAKGKGAATNGGEGPPPGGASGTKGPATGDPAPTQDIINLTLIKISKLEGIVDPVNKLAEAFAALTHDQVTSVELAPDSDDTGARYLEYKIVIMMLKKTKVGLPKAVTHAYGGTGGFDALSGHASGLTLMQAALAANQTGSAGYKGRTEAEKLARMAAYMDVKESIDELRVINDNQDPLVDPLTKVQKAKIEEFDRRQAERHELEAEWAQERGAELNTSSAKMPNEMAVCYLALNMTVMKFLPDEYWAANPPTKLNILKQLFAFLAHHSRRGGAKFNAALHHFTSRYVVSGVDIPAIGTRIVASEVWSCLQDKHTLPNYLTPARLHKAALLIGGGRSIMAISLERNIGQLATLYELELAKGDTTDSNMVSLSIVWYLVLGRENWMRPVHGRFDRSAANIIRKKLGQQEQGLVPRHQESFTD